ncbi:UvrD-helicase domain-containing protein [Elizabethkingia meningoseptica]|uniref:UvrD-helicase domain-containing protein n=1 Tax=Elizabethkingia meningoseptica TaxID=238 RepID=UPI0023AF5A8E|nr:UvrD-helicase domain-containing protein [Elizabethkingia meningoseptica]MDE5439264.1 UvrD-helicase domain-containing protein [Elizabethkingia meningoseptica]MDE5510096.1 UvrD-helicase domain-containing protein [Elizabethkingia meningoseptica]MDE5517000.1 UvrD-helicase domain-containing protein [Elizabethkingia meningoseptica]MDE5527605.1 UvrD-helicase domain-containing protein [Elizabethkingia meningoseptica]MDE5531240.1 UvrD-helicase domain-containing protein [Elizabethkingia meningoseptic
MNSYTVINASAGSGKTYSLIKNLLKICLRNNRPEVIRNILALTFTNKAANEMKERILSWLGDFTSDRYMDIQALTDIQNELKSEGIHLTIDDLHYRSKNLLDYILHHYSALNISTIDKFNTRLIRSFAYELGLPQNFNLEIDAAPFLLEAVDQTLDKIGDNDQLSEAFMDYINYNLDNQKRENLPKTLFDTAKNFNNDIHYFTLEKNKNFDWTAYSDEKEKLRKEIKQLLKDSKEKALSSIELIKSRDLSVEDFSGGKVNSIAVFFEKYLKTETPALPTNGEEKALENYEKLTSAKSKNRADDVAAILPILLDNRKKIILNYLDIEKKKKIHMALLPLKVNKEIQDQLKFIEDENDLLMLSRFNVLINEQLRNEPSAFIYEKVGEQYQHYFFDEFQDTSFLQWQNFLPLRDHILSEESTSFTLVGDPKQSIYRFRGGEAQLMLDIINKKEDTPKYADIQNLEHNYRSSYNIVAFNNQLYQYLSGFVEDDYREIFGSLAQQKPHSDQPGRVKINLVENGNVDLFFEEVAEKMKNDIQESLNNGFSFSDIAILCRGNNDILKFSQLLSGLEVDYKNEKIFIRTISEKGLTLDLSATINAVIQYLLWYSFPKNRRFLVLCLYYLNKSGRIKIHDFSAELSEILQIETTSGLQEKVEKKYNLKLRSDIPNLNTYSFIESILQEFSVEKKETDYLINFLELLYGFFQNTSATLKDFLHYWQEEGHAISIQASENTDAINLMTIHKSKGLEFPVVFLPMKNSHKDSQFNDWYDISDTGDQVLKTVNLTSFNKDLAAYDEGMSSFNEENTYKNKIDRYCIQYVATTRAVEQMFLYIQKPGKSSGYLEIYDFIAIHRNTEEDSFDFFETDERHLLKLQHKARQRSEKELHISSLRTSDETFNTEIKIATPSKSYQERNESVKTGIFTHQILEKVVMREDAAKVLKQYLLDGTITQAEFAEVQSRLNKLFEAYPQYFDGRYEVINERDILFSDNGEYRLLRTDRLLKTSDGWIIIDFKTGAEREKYEDQIETYKKALEQSGEKVWKTDVVYV